MTLTDTEMDSHQMGDQFIEGIDMNHVQTCMQILWET